MLELALMCIITRSVVEEEDQGSESGAGARKSYSLVDDAPVVLVMSV